MALSGDNIATMRRSNRRAVFNYLHEHRTASRKALSEGLDLTAAAITKIVGGLLDEGLLIEGETQPSRSGVGRAQVMLAIEPHARCGLGLFLSIRQAILSGVWLDGSLAFSKRVAIPERADVDAILPELVRRLLDLSDAHNIPRERLTGIGIGARGIVSLAHGTVRDSFGMLIQRDVPLREMVEHLSGLPVVLNNNVRTLFGAHLFLSHSVQDPAQLFLRCEDGIGASIAIGGRILNGGRDLCSEIGHIQVVRQGGRACTCGKCGCLETVASPTALCIQASAICSETSTPLLWRMQKARDGIIALEDVIESARNGDRGTRRIVDLSVRQLGAALKSAIYILDLQRIVLSGRLFDNAYFVARMRAEMSEGIDAIHSGIMIEKSEFTHLDAAAAGILTIEDFFASGGIREA